MKRTTLAIAALLTYMSMSGVIVYADEIENELSAIKARLQQLENQVDKQNDMIRSQQNIIENKSKQIEELAESTKVTQKAVSNM
jgi:archaellum component FlaC